MCDSVLLAKANTDNMSLQVCCRETEEMEEISLLPFVPPGITAAKVTPFPHYKATTSQTKV